MAAMCSNKWVKTQDGGRMVHPFHDMEIYHCECCDGWSILIDGQPVGAYPTEQRAKEVFYMLEGFLNMDSRRIFYMPKK